MDEDDDVTDEMLQEDADWWSKPGAPLRPELRASARATSSVPVAEAEKVVELDVMQIDPPNETASGMNGSSASVESPVLLQPVPVLAVPTSPARLPRSPLSQQIDTEMPDAAFSPVNLSTITTAEELAAPPPQPTHLKSPSPLSHLKSPSPLNQSTHLKSPSPLPTPPTQLNAASPLSLQPIETTEAAKSPLKRDPSPGKQISMVDILGPKLSPPADPVAQANEVAAGFAIETPTEHAEHAQDAGNLSGAGGGIAGEGIVGGGDDDLPDKEEHGGGMTQRIEEDEAILQETKRDLETEIIKDPGQEEL